MDSLPTNFRVGALDVYRPVCKWKDTDYDSRA